MNAIQSLRIDLKFDPILKKNVLKISVVTLPYQKVQMLRKPKIKTCAFIPKEPMRKTVRSLFKILMTFRDGVSLGVRL